MSGRRSSATRFAVGYLVATLALTAVVWVFIYHATVPLMTEEPRLGVSRDVDLLKAQFSRGGLASVRETIRRLESRKDHSQSIFLLAKPARSLRIAGNIDSWPARVEPDGRWRVVRLALSPDAGAALVGAISLTLPDGTWLLAGRRLPHFESFRTTMLLALAMTMAATALISLIGGHLLSRFMLGRVHDIVASAQDIRDGGMERRVPLGGTGDEFDELARLLNSMLSRMEDLISTTRSATDSIAHDFRTPLTRLRTRLEMELGKSQDPAHLRDAIAAALVEIDAVLQTLNSLLQIIRAQGDLPRDQMSTVDLGRMIQDLGELYRPLAEEKGLLLDVQAEAPINIRGSRTLLAQAIANLIDNAIKFSPDGETISVKAVAAGMETTVSVADHGPGIEPAKRELVLKRFVRLDEARSTPGAGLGLSLVSAVAKQHGANFVLEENAPGLKVSIHFPVQARRTRRFSL